MFQPGDMVVYASTGVCRVEEVSPLQGAKGPDQNKKYYRLNPLQQDGVIYAPVDNAKVRIRPVISAQEAEELIDLIPTIDAAVCRAPTLQALAQHYQSAVRSNDCRDLIGMVKAIYNKRRTVEAQKRHLGMVDERYMKQAERLLYGEFSVALGIPFDEVQPYIVSRVDNALDPAAGA